MFNDVIHPIVPLAFRGVVQGMVHNPSHNVADPNATDPRYEAGMIALIRGLRAVFNRPDMPACVLQQSLPGLYTLDTLATTLDLGAWGALRDRQRRVASEPNTGLVVRADIGAHPVATARRAARWALSKVYGGSSAALPMGPMVKALRIEGDKAVVTFDYAGEGLIAGPALVVRSDKVARPVAVRYAFEIAPRGMNGYDTSQQGKARGFHPAGSRRARGPLPCRSSWGYLAGKPPPFVLRDPSGWNPRALAPRRPGRRRRVYTVWDE